MHMKKCNLCSADIPNRIKIDGKIHNISARKYCLSCSPFKNHNTKKLHLSLDKDKDPNIRYCPKCNLDKHTSLFYNRKTKSGGSSYCKECHNDHTADRRLKNKKRCVEYKGNKCQMCGYNKYLGSLAFHHVDPSMKLNEISNLIFHDFEKIKPELEKCKLVCLNCHAEIHGGAL